MQLFTESAHKQLASKLNLVYNDDMITKSQFNILASKMKPGALRDAVFAVMVNNFRQCEALSFYSDVSKQSLYQAIKRMKARQAQFDAMRDVT